MKRLPKIWAGGLGLLAFYPLFHYAIAVTHAEDPELLYNRLGGLAPITVVVNDFIDVMVVDDVLNSNPAVDLARKSVPAAYLKYQVTTMICQATGGPCQYTGRAMKNSHQPLNITPAEWQHMVVLLTGVFNKYELPEKEQQELLAIVDSTKADIVAAE
ncbi:group I truncated hemoglobin [Photobacterium lutimaris]|uniref:Group 1 truncated hemoglobin n=1 Tax=Photobacterium lutimaris TaxID=388278 RepID=A0A2T3IVM4_9GAMM|nr:group 1 truncated hemoglobin [Photobacterium lutimaris]PSU32475.1 group 1 truncated hemoglobin [Photobacterium lutimaris]TDR77683.1 hemoglobin [Photobacterium lutimaris]